MSCCGYRTGVIHDPSRSNWQDSGPRPIAWSAWYPTDAAQGTAPPPHFFDLGPVIHDAALADGPLRPVVLLSHGTGGSAESLSWLARYLAGKGLVVLAANHHGNSGAEPYMAQGFLCWWDRATDLSRLLSSAPFHNMLDLNAVTAVGFSLGAHSVLAEAGARTSMAEFDDWQRSAGIASKGPKEFPDAADKITELSETSAAFRASWARHGGDFTDDRIKALVAIAPAPPTRSLTAASVSAIKLPVTILTGGADTEAPKGHCTDWLLDQNDRFRHYDLGPDVGHYTFLGHPSDPGLVGVVDIFTDAASVDRAEVHNRTSAKVLHALR